MRELGRPALAKTSSRRPAASAHVLQRPAYRQAMASADWAEAMARELLEEALPRRWAHTQGVAATARTLSGILGDDTDLIVAAAWLHGIGYSPAIAVTGFHPLDGARHLRDMEQASALLCCLVAHHSEQRVGEILARYGPDHLVSRAIIDSTPQLIAAVSRITHKFANPPNRPSPPVL